jgi:hypothetical protein
MFIATRFDQNKDGILEPFEKEAAIEAIKNVNCEF